MKPILSLPKKAIIFDLDGVLLDSRPNMEQAWHDVQERLDITVSFEQYFKHIGRPFKDILEIIGLQEQLEEIELIYRQSSKKNIHLATIYPHVVESLQEIQDHNIKFGIVTSKDEERTKIVLNQLPLNFSSIQTPNSQFRGKPAPDHLLAATAQLNIDPNDSLYIGDAEVDAQAALRAGIDYCHANWGYGKTKLDHVTFLSDIQNLLVVLELKKNSL